MLPKILVLEVHHLKNRRWVVAKDGHSIYIILRISQHHRQKRSLDHLPDLILIKQKDKVLLGFGVQLLLQLLGIKDLSSSDEDLIDVDVSFAQVFPLLEIVAHLIPLIFV